jgi:8-oxo-dGTP pyrophosphatase MutT (NUDIX family)
MQENLTLRLSAVEQAETEPWPSPIPNGTRIAYGGLLFDPEGKVLLREPRGHWDGYIWTFAKGRPEVGETPEITALREVLEETGLSACIIAPIPGSFLCGRTVNRYFLMLPDGPVQPLPPGTDETIAIRWANAEDARNLIGQTVNQDGRARDLAVFQSGLVVWKKLISRINTVSAPAST